MAAGQDDVRDSMPEFPFLFQPGQIDRMRLKKKIPEKSFATNLRASAMDQLDRLTARPGRLTPAWHLPPSRAKSNLQSRACR